MRSLIFTQERRQNEFIHQNCASFLRFPTVFHSKTRQPWPGVARARKNARARKGGRIFTVVGVITQEEV